MFGDAIRIAPEALLAQEITVDAHNLSTLLVDSQGVEIVHLDVGLWPDGVGHGACILRVLRCPQPGHILNPLHWPAVHVCAEFLNTHSVVVVSVQSGADITERVAVHGSDHMPSAFDTAILKMMLEGCFREIGLMTAPVLRLTAFNWV